MSKRNETEDNKEKYGPDVYARLELVRKQFQNSVAEKKKQNRAERRERFFLYFRRNRARLVRIAVFVFLSLLVLAVIGVTIFGIVSK